MEEADYVLATGHPVLFLDGFNDQDPILSTEDLSHKRLAPGIKVG